MNSPEWQQLMKERLQLVAAMAELKTDKQLQKEVNKEKKENAKQVKAIKAWLEADANQSTYAITFQKVATDGADLLKKPDLVLYFSQALLQGHTA
jgi:chorismate mutase